MRAEAGLRLEDACLSALGIGDLQRTAIQRPAPVDHRNLVARAVPQHAYAVPGLLGVQPDAPVADIVGEENFHLLFE